MQSTLSYTLPKIIRLQHDFGEITSCGQATKTEILYTVIKLYFEIVKPYGVTDLYCIDNGLKKVIFYIIQSVRLILCYLTRIRTSVFVDIGQESESSGNQHCQCLALSHRFKFSDCQDHNREQNKHQDMLWRQMGWSVGICF